MKNEKNVEIQSSSGNNPVGSNYVSNRNFGDMVKCDCCGGSGKDEYFVGCMKPAWDCCGGCTEIEICQTCDGEGFLLAKNIDCEETERMLTIYSDLKNHRFEHKRILNEIAAGINYWFKFYKA